MSTGMTRKHNRREQDLQAELNHLEALMAQHRDNRGRKDGGTTHQKRRAALLRTKLIPKATRRARGGRS